jgi:adenosine deaminase CECR1
MSHEFYQIMVGAPSMSLHSWKQLARWSIDYSCLSDKQKSDGHEILAKDWTKFCKLVVDKCGDIFNDNGQVDETKFAEVLAKLKHAKKEELS